MSVVVSSVPNIGSPLRWSDWIRQYNCHDKHNWHKWRLYRSLFRDKKYQDWWNTTRITLAVHKLARLRCARLRNCYAQFSATGAWTTGDYGEGSGWYMGGTSSRTPHYCALQCRHRTNRWELKFTHTYEYWYHISVFSGTFITLDISISRLEDVGTADIKGTVEKIRSQRAYSIQMPDQYVFCHLALIEYAIMRKKLQSIDLTGFNDGEEDSE